MGELKLEDGTSGTIGIIGLAGKRAAARGLAPAGAQVVLGQRVSDVRLAVSGRPLGGGGDSSSSAASPPRNDKSLRAASPARKDKSLPAASPLRHDKSLTEASRFGMATGVL